MTLDLTHPAVKVRLRLLLLCVGWGGPTDNLAREGAGWRLGDGILSAPWTGRDPPSDPLEAVEQAEDYYHEDIIMLLRYYRARLGGEG
jgi:hypothetical protein